MAHSTRAKEYRDAKRRAKFGGATISLETRIESGEFTDAAANSIQREVDKARARNIRRNAARTPFRFPSAIARNVRGGSCACGNIATDADHIVPLEYRSSFRASDLPKLAEHFGDSSIAGMTIGQFMTSASNAQGLCSNCNNKKRERFLQSHKKSGFSIIAFLESEQEIAKRFLGNTEMREVKAHFEKEKSAIKRKIRKNSDSTIHENTLNASNYDALKEFETRRAICLKFGIYMGKTEFSREKKRLIEELATR